MKDLIDRIHKLADGFSGEITLIRRHLHRHPELSAREYHTAAYIAEKLMEYGIPFTSGVADTGIVADIIGARPGSVIALRADMDALPIREINAVPYKSVNEGVMHACGHDVHMACLLGAARILQTLRDEITGTIRLIFQPSEEMFPGGAKAMIEAGVLQQLPVEAVIGQHTLPTLEAGKVGMKSGKYMASTDEVYLTVKGRGGHAATPELNTDPVVIAASIITSLQQIAGKEAKPPVPTVLAFGRVIADGRTNIIPDEVKIEGTFRTFDEAWRAEVHEKITALAATVARSMGGECVVVIDKGYPFLVNDEALTSRVFANAQVYLGEENVVELERRMTAEDFAHYARVLPACFYRLGVRNEEKGITSNLHTPTFDVDEKCLETGAGLMAWLAVCELVR